MSELLAEISFHGPEHIFGKECEFKTKILNFYLGYFGKLI